MNRDQFIGFVKSPDTLDAGTTAMLEKLVKAYPYCQTAEILYALNLNKENNFRFNAQLRTAAAYAPDRRLLKQLLNQQRKPAALKTSAKTATAPGLDVAINQPVQDQVGDSLVDKKKKELMTLIDQLKQEVESILVETNQGSDQPLIELASRLEEVIHDHEHPKPGIKPDIKDYNFSHLPDLREEHDSAMSNEALINKFIEEEPKIEAPHKAEFFDAVDYAKHGLEDKQDIVSETLAKVHLKQGNPDKAIKIYERLSLLYPEKSSFFAAQIEKIKKDQHTDH